MVQMLTVARNSQQNRKAAALQSTEHKTIEAIEILVMLILVSD